MSVKEHYNRMLDTIRVTRLTLEEILNDGNIKKSTRKMIENEIKHLKQLN